MILDMMVMWVCGMGLLAAMWLPVHHVRLVHVGKRKP